MSIGQNLLKFRNQINKSQQEVADFLRIDRKTYANWEANTADVKSAHIPELAKFFNVEINDLFREKTSEIAKNQHYSENKENAIDSAIIFLTDKTAVDKLIEVFRNKISVS